MIRKQKGQSLVEYALGIGCVTAVCMLALGFLGHIAYQIIHHTYHGFNMPHHSGPSHATPIVNTGSKPWVLQ
jgi:hypothetical protein